MAKFIPKLLSFFLCFPLMLSAQQTTISGIVSVHNSEYETGKRQYVQDAQVEVELEKTEAQSTDAQGNFKLALPNVPQKTNTQLIVKKESWQVVNIDALSITAATQQGIVRIAMAQPEKIAEYRRQIYYTSNAEIKKNLAALLKQKSDTIKTLLNDKQKNANALSTLQIEYYKLHEFIPNIEAAAKDFAQHYAPINLDDTTPLYQTAFRHFQRGESEKAMQVLTEAGLARQANEMIAEERVLSDAQRVLYKQDVSRGEHKKNLLQALNLKAALHKMAFQLDSVQLYLTLMVDLDSKNINALSDMANLFSDQNKHKKAIAYYEKVLALANSADSIEICNRLGLVYYRTGKIYKAKKYHLQSLDIAQRLAQHDPQRFEAEVAKTAMDLGDTYFALRKKPQVEGYYLKSLYIYERLAKNDPQQFEADLALALKKYGIVYQCAMQYDRSRGFLIRSLALHRKALFNGTTHNPYEYNRVFRLLECLRKRYIAQNNFSKAVEVQIERTKSLEIMREKYPAETETAANEYGSLSWWALFAKDYALSEKAALRCLELDATKEWVLTSLGHSQLFRGQYDTALATYNQLKGKKSGDRSYKDVLLQDFKSLAEKGIKHEDLARAKAEIKNW